MSSTYSVGFLESSMPNSNHLSPPQSFLKDQETSSSALGIVLMIRLGSLRQQIAPQVAIAFSPAKNGF